MLSTFPLIITDGAYASAQDAAATLIRLFESKTIDEVPGAEYYCVCYGDLCAYDDQSELHAYLDGPEFPSGSREWSGFEVDLAEYRGCKWILST